ncbi:MAG: CARDB domain-containing protein, partial [Bacteroidota bacterium]
FNIPMLGNNASAGVCYIYVYADGDDDIYEFTDEGNNVLRSNPIVVFAPPPVDLTILNATNLSDTLSSGQSINVQWMIENLGSSTEVWDYGLWYDGIYLSTDEFWSNDDLFVKDFTQAGPLGTNQTYADNQVFDLPQGISGDYYILLVADNVGLLNDGNDVNNVRVIYPQSNPDGSGPLKTIHIELSPSPDLQVNTFVAPSAGTSGQPIQVHWKVTNAGAGMTTGTWTDKVYLSTDFIIDQGDLIIGTQSQELNLATNESYEDTIDVFLPSSVAGNFVLIFRTDANNTVFEFNGENNNTFLTYLTVSQPPPSDLLVSDINFSNMAMVGEPFSINYTVKNEGTNPASGQMRDLLYFSVDSIFDASDVRFVDPIFRTINLAPQGTANTTVTSNTPGLPLGDYYIVAHTDILDNIVEQNDTNNVRIAMQKVTISVKELLMNVPTADTLENNQELYCRIEIPDSLVDETLLLSLDALPVNSVNELYLSFNEIPTRSNHDFSFSEPFAPDQEIVVPELQKGTYYLMAFGNTVTGGSEQDIILHAQVIDFSIREVNSNEGGNTGNVTVKVEGAKFTPDMTMFLDDPSLGTIYATAITFINSAEVFATFPLNGALEGLYDIKAEKSNGESTMLEDGFEVILGDLGTTTVGGTGNNNNNGFFCNIVNTGTELNLSRNLAHPAAVRVNRLVPITIQFGNGGNVDIPCPARFIISLRGAPLSFDPDDFTENKQELYLEFQEPGGPPGILRPGASAAITVYSFSSSPLRFLIAD